MATTQSKRFEDWCKVDCEECERWWLNQCDGVPKGSQKQCNSYLATRNVVLPEKIKSLENRVLLLEWLILTVGLLAVVMFLLWGVANG